MIWDIIEESNFDQHFKDSSLTIQTLLLDQNILTEMQNLNPLLIDFLNNNQEHIINRLIQYVTVMPTEEQGYDRCHKLPYISSEMLAIDNNFFHSAFFPESKEDKHLQHLFQFLKNETAIGNTLLLGYFNKVVGNLYRGKKVQFTRAIAKNIQLFGKHLDKQTIGSILQDCVILINTDEGVLLKERMEIVEMLMDSIVKEKEKRSICGSVLVQIMGKFQTFSSGDEILEQILKSNNFIKIYELHEDLQVSICVEGVLKKSKMKKYDIETDSQQNIFKLPQNHKQKIIKFIGKRLNEMIKLDKQNSSNKKVHKHIIQYFELVKNALDNELDGFLSEQLMQFIWKYMDEHPKSDILLVTLVKIINYAINKKKIDLEKTQVYQRLINLKRKNQKLYQPHIFLIWQAIRQLNLKPLGSPKQWEELCIKYQKLLPLYDTKNVKKVERPTNAKLIIDQEDMAQAQVKQVQQVSPQKQKQQVNTEPSPQKQKAQINIFNDFGFFGSSTKSSNSQTKQVKKNDQFADFMNFGK